MATLAEEILSLAERAGTECNTLHNKVGELTELTTTAQGSTVEAINELKSSVDSLSDGGETDIDAVASFESALAGTTEEEESTDETSEEVTE